MVSGFLISPNDHERIFSGEAIAIWIWSNACGAATGANGLVISWFILVSRDIRRSQRRTRFHGRKPRHDRRDQTSLRWGARASAERLPLFGRLGRRRFVRQAFERGQFDVEAQRTHFLD